MSTYQHDEHQENDTNTVLNGDASSSSDSSVSLLSTPQIPTPQTLEKMPSIEKTSTTESELNYTLDKLVKEKLITTNEQIHSLKNDAMNMGLLGSMNQRGIEQALRHKLDYNKREDEAQVTNFYKNADADQLAKLSQIKKYAESTNDLNRESLKGLINLQAPTNNSVDYAYNAIMIKENPQVPAVTQPPVEPASFGNSMPHNMRTVTDSGIPDFSSMSHYELSRELKKCSDEILEATFQRSIQQGNGVGKMIHLSPQLSKQYKTEREAEIASKQPLSDPFEAEMEKIVVNRMIPIMQQQRKGRI